MESGRRRSREPFSCAARFAGLAPELTMTRRSPFDPLKEAAKYVRAFRSKPFVVKIGGDILADSISRKSICGQLALLSSFGIPLVIVHGGGQAIDGLCQHLGFATQKVAGRRVTTPEVLEAAKMVLKGGVQMELIGDLQAAGLFAVGLSGQDAGLLRSVRRPPVVVDGQNVDFGCVGDIESVEPRPLRVLIDGGYVPVIAPFTVDVTEQILNTNADSIRVTIYGKGGHGAAPHTAVDPIVIAARTILVLQTIVAREVKPGEMAVVTVGYIRAGDEQHDSDGSHQHPEQR